MARVFLALNGKRINTLDDLRANFNGKQVLDFYRAGRLQKWLEELGENELLEDVQGFQNEKYDDETLLSMLMAVFDLDENVVAEQISLQKQEKLLAEMRPAAEAPKAVPEKSETADEPGVEYTPEERNILRIRNKFLSIMRTVFADDMLDYEKHLDVSFADFGISEELQEKLKEKLAVEFKFYPVEYESDLCRHENGLIYAGESPFSVLCSILHKFGPDCFREASKFDFECRTVGSFSEGIAYPIKYKDFLVRGKKDAPKKILSGTLDEWASKGGELPGKIGEFAAALKPRIPEYESADVKAKAELKYHKQKAALALLEDHFKISSDPKTRYQTILLETDLKTHCGFGNKQILEFNKKLIALFPDHVNSANPHASLNAVLHNCMIDIAQIASYPTYGKKQDLDLVAEVAAGAFFETDETGTTDDPITDILHATIADIFRFCKCL